MTFAELVSHATDKTRFATLDNYLGFCCRYLDYIETGLQARIVSQNEHHYQFFQYREEGHFKITRPLNSRLMYDAESFSDAVHAFPEILAKVKDHELPTDSSRETIIRTIYTVQQAIGATLDGLSSGLENKAKKVNGDLFERLIRLILTALDIECLSGVMRVPIKDSNGNLLLTSTYQHDLLIRQQTELKIIGSVKTSSKDRIDKVFLDKFLYSKLTETDVPHIAIFLNDVQRKKTKHENQHGINSTFLSGHFKAYTIKLNSLDGVYYCDIRPNMLEDSLPSQHIKTIDHFFYSDLWTLLNRRGQVIDDVVIEPEPNGISDEDLSFQSAARLDSIPFPRKPNG